MERTVGVFVTLALAVSFVNVARAETMAEGSSAPFLYTVVASEGAVADVGDNTYVLILPKNEIKHVLEVSEKPFGLANSISANKIVETWESGAGNFGEGISMKAWLLATDELIAPINVTAIAKSEEDMRIDFFLDSNAKLDADKLGELIDVTVVNYCCHPDGGGAEWLWGN